MRRIAIILSLAAVALLCCQCAKSPYQLAKKGAKSVRIGHYSVEMADSGAGDLLTPRRLCGAAYGVLLYAGLLYKGVERV